MQFAPISSRAKVTQLGSIGHRALLMAAGTVALGVFAVAANTALVPSAANASGQISRSEVYRGDLEITNPTEVIVARLEIEPGASIPRHSHNGEEHLVVLEGGTATYPNGETIDLKPGMTLNHARDVVHGGVTFSSDKPLVLFTVHIVDKDAPLNVAAQ